jgi:hypothetical protein
MQKMVFHCLTLQDSLIVDQVLVALSHLDEIGIADMSIGTREILPPPFLFLTETEGTQIFEIEPEIGFWWQN